MPSCHPRALRLGRLRAVARGLLALGVALVLAIAPGSARPAAQPRLVAPALWVVRDADTVVHLFGTVHALPRGVGWFRPPLVAALDAADELVLEALVPSDPTALMGLTLRMARSPTPRPLAQRVPPERAGELADAVRRLGAGDLDAFDTWYVALTLSNLAALAAGFDPATGAEAVLAARAALRSIPTTGLETPEEQLGYFKALPEAEQRAFLVATLEELPNARADLETLLADWLAGRTEALERRINKALEASPMLRQMLLFDRNVRWADWIARRMARPGRVFLAVGAGHLVGPGSLLAELERRGLRPERAAEPAPGPRRRRSF